MIDNLKAVIRGRPVAILLPGPSIKELEVRIKELKKLDICYASVNDFWVMEKEILSHIDKQIEILLASAKECRVPNRQHTDYLNRKPKNIFLTSKVSFERDLVKYMQTYPDRLIFFTTDHNYQSLQCPSPERPVHFFAQASLAVLLSFILIGGADTVLLFGADGGDRKRQGLYYKGWTGEAEFKIGYDTGVFNMTMPTLLQNVCKTYPIEKLLILNFSPDSYYVPFPRLTYDNALKFLKEEYGHLSQSGIP